MDDVRGGGGKEKKKRHALTQTHARPQTSPHHNTTHFGGVLADVVDNPIIEVHEHVREPHRLCKACSAAHAAPAPHCLELVVEDEFAGCPENFEVETFVRLH